MGSGSQAPNNESMDNENVRKELSDVQRELHEAISGLMEQVGKKLKPAERAEIQEEFDSLNELIERVKTGRVWISMFGKVNVGKSCVGNSLLGRDQFEASVKQDWTTKPQNEQHNKYVIVDVPGIMGNEVLEDIAVEEAKKAHGILFVLDGEPYGTEIKLFDLVHQATPRTPKYVFVNKMDLIEAGHTRKEVEVIRERVTSKMQKYVTNPADIVYGSARLKDPTLDEMVRQPLPQLEERLYDEAGLLGDTMNIVDPAGRAESFAGQVRTRVLEARIRVARKAINAFAISSTVGGLVPFGDLIVAPGIFGGMVLTLSKLMGQKLEKGSSKDVAVELLKVCGQVLVVDFAALTAISVAADAIGSFFGPVGLFLTAAAGGVGLGVWRYRRTIIFGEVVLEYLKRGFSWGGEDREKVIKECKERALKIYNRKTKTVEATA